MLIGDCFGRNYEKNTRNDINSIVIANKPIIFAGEAISRLKTKLLRISGAEIIIYHVPNGTWLAMTLFKESHKTLTRW
jgi:hypothetical protein